MLPHQKFDKLESFLLPYRYKPVEVVDAILRLSDQQITTTATDTGNVAAAMRRWLYRQLFFSLSLPTSLPVFSLTQTKHPKKAWKMENKVEG